MVDSKVVHAVADLVAARYVFPEVFLAQRLEGLSHQEIARRCRISTSTVEHHIAKALLQLTTWMEGW